MSRRNLVSRLTLINVSVACALVLGDCATATPTPQVIVQTSPPQIQTQQVIVTQLVPQIQTQIVVATNAPATPAPTTAPTAVPPTAPPTSVVPTVPGLLTSVFTQGTDKMANPDDNTLMGTDFFIGFQNGVGPDGAAATSGAISSTVAEIDPTGKVITPGVAQAQPIMAAPGDSGVAGFVATVDLTSGLIKPIAIGMKSPHGLIFIPKP